MTRLLRANFARLWKTTSFWVCMFFSVAFPMLMSLLNGSAKGFFVEMYNTTPVSLFFSAVSAVLFIGTDNSDKTLRNRITIGASRVKMYFANFLTVSFGMILIFAVSWGAILLRAAAMGGWFDIKVGNLVLYAALCLAAGAAMTALCTLSATLITSKAAAVAVTITLFIGMYAASSNVKLVNSTNDLAELAYNILPTSQISEIEFNVLFWDGDPDIFTLSRTIEPLWYSLGLSAAATVGGALAFRKKDIK